MDNSTVYYKNVARANELQKKFGLTELLHDLFAWEELTEAEVIGLQRYRDCTYPKYTGDIESDSKLQEAFEKKCSTLALSENQLVDPKAKSLYESCCLELDEAFELQRLRAVKS